MKKFRQQSEETRKSTADFYEKAAIKENTNILSAFFAIRYDIRNTTGRYIWHLARIMTQRDITIDDVEKVYNQYNGDVKDRIKNTYYNISGNGKTSPATPPEQDKVVCSVYVRLAKKFIAVSDIDTKGFNKAQKLCDRMKKEFSGCGNTKEELLSDYFRYCFNAANSFNPRLLYTPHSFFGDWGWNTFMAGIIRDHQKMSNYKKPSDKKIKLSAKRNTRLHDFAKNRIEALAMGHVQEFDRIGRNAR